MSKSIFNIKRNFPLMLHQLTISQPSVKVKSVFTLSGLPLPIILFSLFNTKVRNGHPLYFFYKFIYLFIYFWLHWVFVAARGLSLVVASRGYSSLRCTGFSLW